MWQNRQVRFRDREAAVSAAAASDVALRYRPWQVRIFAATWLAYAGYYFCRKPFYVAKADMGTALGFSSVELAHLGTAYLAAYAVGQFSSAWFGRQLGPRLLLLAGIAISVVSNFTFGIANGFGTLLLFLSLNGLAQGTGWPGCIGSLAFWFRREERGTVLGMWSTCYQVGSLVSTALAAYLLGRLGWRWSYFGGSLALLAIWAAVLALHPNRPEAVGLPPLEEEEERSGPAAREHSDGLGWSRDVLVSVVIMGVIYFTIKFLRYTLWSWAPFFLRRNFGLAGDQAGYLSTVFEVCGFAGVIVAGVVSDRVFHGRRAFLSFLMLALMTASFVLMATLGSKNVFFFALGMGLAGFLLFGPDSLVSGVGAIDVGSRRGALAAAGIINGMGSVGPIVQEEVVGWMYKASGGALAPILGMLVGLAGLGAFVTFLLWRRARAGKANL